MLVNLVNIIQRLHQFVENSFNYVEFSNFCRIHQEELKVSFENIMPIGGATASAHYEIFILALKEQKRLGQFIKILVKEKGDIPEIIQMKEDWSRISEQDNTSGNDQYKIESFDLIFINDNTEDFPFINREDFKKHIWKSINDQKKSSLRLAINGVKGVGITYLRQYLTELDKKINCLKKYIIIDCKEDLMIDPNDEVFPAHIAKSLIDKIGIDISYIDPEDPTKFKERYFPQFFSKIQIKCESDGEPVVFFIDHIHHEMRPEIFRFFDKFIYTLKQFRVPYLLILGGLVKDKLNSPNEIKEMTLTAFKEDDLRVYLTKIYHYLKFTNSDKLGDAEEGKFVEDSLLAFNEILATESGAPVEKVQSEIKRWYEVLQESMA